MFFQSAQHQGCVQKLELAIRLRRGLSVVVGDIGTGKSTLCRQLIQVVTKGNTSILPYLILDSEFTTPLEFLRTIVKTFGLDCNAEENSEWQLKDTIKKYLFEESIQNQKIPLLILDEGQKLPGFAVEILREFLNFETNQYKLLQIVIFAQKEFEEILKQKANFADRITTYQYLQPLSFHDTRLMIDFRLKKSHTEDGPVPKLFSPAAILAIYCLTRGYPRRIVMLCSKVIITILVTQIKQAGVFDVLRAARDSSSSRTSVLNRILLMCAVVVLCVLAAVFIGKDKMPDGNGIISAMREKAPALEKEVRSSHGQNLSAQGKKSEASTLAVAPSAQSSSPLILGSVAVEKGVTISKMIARVYGRYSPSKLAMVLAVNPQITTPDDVEVETVVHFPVLPDTEFSAPTDRIRVELQEARALAEAYDTVKGYPEKAPPLLIMPAKSAEGNFRFHVILDESFLNENAAYEQIKELPVEWRTRAKVMLPK
ncbi:MAG: AAA family ATPase [Desulfobulbaceae bacterium]|nr:AAA family ATPase [Desulfobulbaceae bacterium]